MPPVTHGESREGNFIAEYFGHQVYPKVASSTAALDDQLDERCPFLSRALEVDTKCSKPKGSFGICTVNTAVDGVRYDWLVCPDRALDPSFMSSSARHLFGYSANEPLHFIGAKTLNQEKARGIIRDALQAGERVLIYFQEKIGGELGISKTPMSPEFSFDWTLLEVTAITPRIEFGRMGILELQTMDFHGSYQHALHEVQNALADEPDEFHDHLMTNEGLARLSKKMEGPNLSNVFKRTFYQMAYKFQLTKHEDCAGAGFVIPHAVWQSWLRHLGGPNVIDNGDGTSWLETKPVSGEATTNTWIFVFEFEDEVGDQPRKIRMWRPIRVEVDVLINLALHRSPRLAVEAGEPMNSVRDKATKRIRTYWREVVPTQRRSRRPAAAHEEPLQLDL